MYITTFGEENLFKKIGFQNCHNKNGLTSSKTVCIQLWIIKYKWNNKQNSQICNNVRERGEEITL